MAGLSVEGRPGVPELMDSLHTFKRAQPEHVIAFPPNFEVVPCKPLLFDVARNSIAYPDLSKQPDVAAAAGGRGGLVGSVAGNAAGLVGGAAQLSVVL